MRLTAGAPTHLDNLVKIARKWDEDVFQSSDNDKMLRSKQKQKNLRKFMNKINKKDKPKTSIGKTKKIKLVRNTQKNKNGMLLTRSCRLLSRSSNAMKTKRK